MIRDFEQPSGTHLSPGAFSGKYFYSPSFDSDYERVVHIARRAKKDQTRIHRLTDDKGSHYGFIALAISVSDHKPCVVIDYLFVSKQYRGIRYPEFENRKIAEILIGYAWEIATDANRNYPVRYLALEPANDKLGAYYTALAFCKLDSTNFMYLRL